MEKIIVIYIIIQRKENGNLGVWFFFFIFQFFFSKRMIYLFWLTKCNLISEKENESSWNGCNCFWFRWKKKNQLSLNDHLSNLNNFPSSGVHSHNPRYVIQSPFLPHHTTHIGERQFGERPIWQNKNPVQYKSSPWNIFVGII